MRIVIDLQGAQADNCNRGIGRYSLSLALTMARNPCGHEIVIALNSLFPNSIDKIRGIFGDLLPQGNICVWKALAPVDHINKSNNWRRQTSELIREAYLASLRPDVVHVSSIFEGLGDNAISSVGALSRTIPTAVTLYDLIPYLHPHPYLENPAVKNWYLSKINHLRNADLWLSISESSRQEGIDHLGLADERLINISADADSHFQPRKLSKESEQELRHKYGLHRPFIMYTGGIDHRKNIEGLIRAFSILPPALRKNHQLAIVCSIQPESRLLIERLATQHGYGENDVILTGYVPDDDLISLYNLCTLFVFPSFHEGFGLPVLEAMRCGAPVISTNSSSLPEVIGWQGALFDPHSDEAMASLIERALVDTVFRAALIQNGEEQAAKFSWDVSARKAIAAMEELVYTRSSATKCNNIETERPRLAFISPLPPERTGIADYSAELLPELSRYYRIEAIVSQDTISHSWIEKHCPVRSVHWFIENAKNFDRVLYHFGNSVFHQHMFDLIEKIPGVVVLHDFFLSGITSHLEKWTQELYKSHGYQAIHDRFHIQDTAHTIWKYPCSLSVIQDSLGVIVHSPYSLELAQQWYGGELTDWATIPMLRDTTINSDKALARKKLGISGEDFLVCTFGMIGPTKLSLEIAQAWLKSSLAQDKTCQLIFVGKNQENEYGRKLLLTIGSTNRNEDNIRITGWAERDAFHLYLAAADVGVQLRTLSRGETSAAVLDCMNFGLATIVNANGSMRYLDNSAVLMLPDEFTVRQLIESLEILRNNKEIRINIGKNAREIVKNYNNPHDCAKQYAKEIENFYRIADIRLPGLPKRIAQIRKGTFDDKDLINSSSIIAHNFPLRNQKKQLFVDISELVQRNVRSGVQRVVCNIINQWLITPPDGYRIEPVYSTGDNGYRYARQFILNFLKCNSTFLHDDAIDYSSGDIFFGLDLQPQIICENREFYKELRRNNIKVFFTVYDLLCVNFPQYFLDGASAGFTKWLEVVTENDGAVCISKTVSVELASWVRDNNPSQISSFITEWFHLGADVGKSVMTTGIPTDADLLLEQLSYRHSFLMVGTIEPRKGHIQVLSAFERLWLSGLDVNLIIVGKHGWMMETFLDLTHGHGEYNKRLFWLEAISDEYLENIYEASTCLIAASYGEGFGLPLIEAAQHQLPIIARDIPVFREVAGDHAYFFTAKNADDLAAEIAEWLELFTDNKHPQSSALPWMTWEESSKILMNKLLKLHR